MVKAKHKVSLVRKKPQANWSLLDLQTMLLWKKQKGDKAPSKIKAKDKAVTLWELCKGQNSPVCSPPGNSGGKDVKENYVDEDDGLAT